MFGSRILSSLSDLRELESFLSAQAWYEYFETVQLTDKFDGTKIAPPELMPWGLFITYVWDPAGVLLHFAEQPAAKT